MAQTTIVSFAALPTCATKCGVLFDVNGACVPPAKPTADANTYDNCLCQDSRLAPFQTGTSGVCDSAGCDANGLSSIRSWYTSLCSGRSAAATATGTSGSGSSSNSGGGSWISTHARWVAMIVIIVVGIVGIWVGACIWRRRYLKRKDRLYELGKGLPSSVAVNTEGQFVGPGAARHSAQRQPGMFMSGSGSPESAIDEKARKEKEKSVPRR